jgi:5-oxoprolinase (ATP-hydrolysing) subunit A
MRTVDLNADVGEGFPHDSELIAIVTSANVACGFHAGDAATMRWVCGLCVEHGVAIGAQVSYRDRVGFGRRPVEIGYGDLLADLVEQRAALEVQAAAVGGEVRYLKPHGALYHRVGWDREQAQALVDAAAGLPILGAPGSVLLERAAAAGVPAVREFFADRGYAADGTLVPRTHPEALLSTPSAVADRVAELVGSGAVVAVDGTIVRVAAESICVHGDTMGAPGLAGAVRDALTACDVALQAFATGRSR